MLVVLLVGRVVAPRDIGPVAARAFTMAAFGLVVVGVRSFFVNARTEPCPPAALASGHEALVRIPHAQLHVSRIRPPEQLFDRVVEQAQAAEDSGFALVTVMDHLYQIGGVGRRRRRCSRRTPS